MMDTEKKALPLWRRILLWLIAGAIVVMVAAMVFDYLTGVRLSSAIEKIAARNEPLTFSAFGQRFASPGADADIYYSESLASIHPENLGNLIILDSVYRQSLSVSDSNKPAGDIGEKMPQILGPFQSQLNKLDIGADKELSIFDLGVDRGVEGMTSRLNMVQTAGTLLSIRGLYAIDRDEPAKAAESIVSLMKLIRVLDVNPVIPAYPVKAALSGLACDNTRLMIGNCSGIEGLSKLQSEFGRLAGDGGLENMFVAERIRQLELARNVVPAGTVSKYFSKEVPEMKGRISLPRSKLTRLRIRLKLTQYLEDMEEILAACRQGWPVPLDIIKSDVPANTEKKKTMMQIASSFTRLNAGTLAMVRSTMLAIAADRYRLEKGKVCWSVDELVGGYIESIPVDPFSGSALLYKAVEDGYIIYSVGDNRQDDGGAILSIDKQTPLDMGIKVRLDK